MTTADFTERELKILKLLSQGQTGRQVARSLQWMLSVTEVERAIIKMMNQHRCENRTHLVATALRRGVIQ